jgi:outer membrane protein OmpA-like peptidoglycan-associated protein
MKRAGFYGWLAVITIVAISSVGCVDWKKKYMELQTQYAELNTKHNTLTEQNNAIRMQLAEVESERGRIQTELQTATGKLTAAEAEAGRLRTGQPPTGTDVRTGGERTLYKTTVGSDILFSSGRATLTDPGKRALDSVIATLKSSYPNMTVRVYGYTDNDPIVKTKNLWQDNLDLSANRAMAVTRYLWSKGITASHVETVAMGEAHPVSTANKAKNRRVEITVVK